jgi:hypothetical protein
MASVRNAARLTVPIDTCSGSGSYTGRSTGRHFCMTAGVIESPIIVQPRGSKPLAAKCWLKAIELTSCIEANPKPLISKSPIASSSLSSISRKFGLTASIVFTNGRKRSRKASAISHLRSIMDFQNFMGRQGSP